MQRIKTNILRICIVSLALQLVFALLTLGIAPGKIIAHYNATGEATRYGSKYEILLLPLACSLFVLLGKYIFNQALATKKCQQEGERFAINIQHSFLVYAATFTAIALVGCYYVVVLSSGLKLNVFPLLVFVLATVLSLYAVTQIHPWQKIILPLLSILLVGLHHKIGVSFTIVGLLLPILFLYGAFIYSRVRQRKK